MPRATNAVTRKRRKKKVLGRAKGYFGRKHSSYRLANEQVMRSTPTRTGTAARASGTSGGSGSPGSTRPPGGRG